jgi:tight adherence protein B
MLKLMLFVSLFLLFFCLTVGEFPDALTVKEKIIRFAVPGAGAVLFFLISWALLGTPVAALIWAVLGWFVPGWIINFIGGKKRARLKSMARDFVTSASGLYAVGLMSSEVVRIMADRFPEPFASDFRKMIAAWNNNYLASFPKMFRDMADKYNLPEFEAVSTILAASETAGGPVAASKGLKRLGRALRQRDRLMTERAKATLEPKIAAVVTILLLTVGLILDGTVLRQMFTGPGKMIMTVSSALLVGLIFMLSKITKSEDLA